MRRLHPCSDCEFEAGCRSSVLSVSTELFLRRLGRLLQEFSMGQRFRISENRLYILLLVLLASSARAESEPLLVLNPSGHTGYLRDVLFANDSTVVSGGYDGTVRQWDFRSGEDRQTLRMPLGLGHQGEVHGIAVSPSRRHLVVGGWFAEDEAGRHGLRLYDLSTGKLLSVTHGHSAPVRALAFSDDSRWLATGDASGLVQLWQFDGEGQFSAVNSFQAHDGRVTRIAFSQAGPQSVVTIGYDGIIRFFQYGSGKLVHHRSTHPAQRWNTWAIGMHPRLPVVAIGTAAPPSSNFVLGRIEFFSTSGEPLPGAIDLPEGVASAAFMPTGEHIVIGTGFPSSRSAAYVYSYPGRSQVRRYGGHSKTVVAIAVSTDGRRIASVDAGDQMVHVWDRSTGLALRTLGSSSPSPWNVAFTNDGRRLRWGPHLYDPDQGVADDQINRRGRFDWSFDLGNLTLSQEVSEEGKRGVLQANGVSLGLTRPGGKEQVQLQPAGILVSTGKARDKILGMTLVFPEGRGAKAVIAGTHTLRVLDAKTGRTDFDLIGHRGEVAAVAPCPNRPYVVSAGDDKTVRIWNVVTGELLLSLFHEGEEWVLWTPTGHFASSPRGERLMGWMTSDGPDTEPKFFDGTQFHEALYRPDIIRRVFETGSVAEALKGTRGGQVSAPDILPPEVEVLEPGARVETPIGEEITIKVRARSPGVPVNEMSLYLDQRPYEGRQSQRKVKASSGGWVTESWTIQAPPGVHEFSVRASTGRSHSDSRSIRVRSGVQKTDRKLVVLAIGVANYQDPTIDRLFYADQDANKLCEVLKTQGKNLFTTVECRALTNELATKRNILDGLKWLREQVGPNDVGVVFYSGHGSVDRDFGFHFFPHDIDDDQIADRGLAGSQFNKALAEVKGRLIVMLDACHAGGVGLNGASSQSLTEDVVHSLTNEQPGVDLLCSTDAKSVSEESHELRQGYFTHAVLEGLRGEANYRSKDVNDGIVSSSELVGYVETRLKRLTSNRQTPVSGKSSLTELLPVSEDRQ